MSPTVRKILLVTDTFREDRLTVYAAQTAFYICISAIPFVMLFMLLTNLLAPSVSFELASDLEAVLPDGSFEILGFVFDEARAGADFPLISTAAIAALWSASKGMRAIMRGVSEVYKVSVKGKMIRTVVQSIIYTLLFMGLLFLTVLFFVLGEIPFVRIYFKGLSSVLRYKSFFFLFFLSLYFSLLYYVVASGGLILKRNKNLSSECPKSYVSQLSGAVTASVGWLLFSYFYSLYLKFFPRSSYVYGSLAAVVFLLLWLYFCIFIILLGAEINKLLYLRKKRVKNKIT